MAGLEVMRGHEQAGQRPVLILSEDAFNDRPGTVIGVALTNQPQKAGFPLALESLDTNLPKRTWAKMSQVRTLSVQRLQKRIGKASAGEMDQIVECLNELIGGTD